MPAQGPRNQAAKGNPASHRMGNPKRAARRARNWEAQQKRKDANRAANKARELANKALAKELEPMPFLTKWQKAEANRNERRKGKQIAYALLHDTASI